MKISFVIITGGKRPESMERLLASILAQGPYESETIVVGRAENLPQWARLIHAPELADTAAICRMRNIGVAESSGDPVILLDDDIELHHGWLDAISAKLADETWDIASSKVLGPSGERWYDWCWASRADPACPSRMLEYGEVSPNLYISGCMMIIRRRVLDKVLFNENLMNHQRDDVDFCHRALDAGFKFACFTDAVATHHLEPSGRSESDPASGFGGFPEAIFRFRKKDYAGAMEILITLEDFPENTYHGALCLKNLGLTEKAAELFNKTVLLTDNGGMKRGRLYYSALFHLGTLAESRGDMNCAEECYAKALSGFPEHKEAAIGLERARRGLLR